jgi:hypothetical protein
MPPIEKCHQFSARSNKIKSREAWETSWGELVLAVTDKGVTVIATTAKLSRIEQENKKDEF